MRKIHRETVGVVQLEGLFAPDFISSFGARPFDDILEEFDAVIERAPEALLFRPDHLLHLFLRGGEFRVGRAHLFGERRHEPVEEGIGQAEIAAIPRRAAEDAPEDVAPTLVGRQGAVGYGEGQGPDVIGEHAVGHGRIPFRVGMLRQFADVVHQRAEHVGFVVRIHALEDAEHAFEAHARVHVTGRQGRQHAVGSPVVLDEDQVPDFHVSCTVSVDPADVTGIIFPAASSRTQVEVDFRVGPAGPGLAHFPEVVLLVESQDPVGGDAGVALPEVLGLVVLPEHGRPQPFGGEFPPFREQFPGPGYGFFLVVVAEGPVPKHFEEGLMDGRPAHVFEVVVLAAGANALLIIHRAHVFAGAFTQENVLELVHPRVGEEQRGIIPGHYAGTRHDRVVAVGEEAGKGLSQFGSGQFRDSSISSSTRWTTW